VNSARRESLGYCAETCPEVDATFSDLLSDLRSLIAPCNEREVDALLEAACQRVKDKGTLLLRAALDSACDDKQDVEADRDELATEVRNLGEQVAALRSEIAQLERELEAVTA